uniref:N-acyl-aromatic-L-amino acid amidohydrolase n=1 Tax=Ictalurus furcatus TaxID=66913 RepID=E3TCL7_ICTFU|nr:aspartoacylase-2a [Ictalurus furcatus]
MEMIRLPALRRVAICGGAHGNEMTGIYLVPELERQQKEKGDAAWSVPLTTVLSNPHAIKACSRYIDKDLNRCFTSPILSSPISEDTPYEVQRAQELNSLLGPKGSEDAVDIIIDLHNTTANMGLSIISYEWSNSVCFQIFKHLQDKITNVPVRLVLINVPPVEAFSLESVAKCGVSLEVGPQPQGVVRADIFNIMKQGVDAVLDWTETFNSGKIIEGGEVEVYLIQKSMDYPRDPKTGKPTAAIHPQLQDQDFCLLQRGDPVFLTSSGETLSYEEEEPLHPLSINEAAYYEKGIAFHLASKKTLSFPSIQAKTD